MDGGVVIGVVEDNVVNGDVVGFGVEVDDVIET